MVSLSNFLPRVGATILPTLLLLLLSSSVTTANDSNNTTDTLSFGLINGASAFFDPILEGWLQRCKEKGVKCFDAVGDDEPATGCTNRSDIVHSWIDLGVNGIAMSPSGCKRNEELVTLFQEAKDLGVPIVTFDADVANSSRAAYVGTDNQFLGRTMARLLRQLRPEGGTFAVIGVKPEREEGFVEEITKFNDRDDRPHWFQVFGELDKYQINYLEQMEEYAQMNVTSIITMIQSPMRDPNWTSFVEEHRHRRITYVGTDGSDYQLSYLNRRFVDGLVGQLPFEMGTKSLDVLYEIATTGKTTKEIHPTNLVSYNLIPLELPPPEVDQNLIGNMRIVGYVCYAIVVLTALACIGWTFYHHADIVVRAAQPFFLAMVAGGVIIMSSSLIPLSFDDNGDPMSMTETKRKGICMSIPWLLFVGFAITFSALLSKTWRVNRLFHAKVSYARIQVSVKDVLLPFVILLLCNIVVLICWTVIDPLMYLRLVDIGTDSWNREISSYGGCRCENAVAYLVPLAVVNLIAVGIACWQAYQARGIKSEFSESKYIGLAVFSLFQAFLLGIPVIAVVRNMPEAYYLVLTLMIFLLCMAVLLLIYMPKMFMQRKYAGMTESEQKRAMRDSLKQSSRPSSARRDSASGSDGRAGEARRNSGASSGRRLSATQQRSGGSSSRMGASTRNLARQIGLATSETSSEAAAAAAAAEAMQRENSDLEQLVEENPAVEEVVPVNESNGAVGR